MDSHPTGSKDILLNIETEILSVTIKGKIAHSYVTTEDPSSCESTIKIFCKDVITDIDLPNETSIITLPSVNGWCHFTEHKISEPLFYEQQSYEILVNVKEAGHTATFWHDNQNIRESVTPTDKNQSHLSGIINFRNEIGFSSLKIGVDQDTSEYLEIIIEIFPSKISYKKDYHDILTDITDEVYNLVFDFLKRTYLSYQFGEYTGNSLVEFFSILKQIYGDFISATDRILSHPHHQLEVIHEVLPAHKIKQTDTRTIRWLERHPDQVKIDGSRISAERALAVKKHVTYNTKENRLAKHMLQMTVKRLDDFKKKYAQLDRPNDQNVIEEIDAMIKNVTWRCNDSFLAEVDSNINLAEISLVFSMAPGYQELYKYYLMLQRGLSISGDMFNISRKDLAVLYEYWCFIKLNRIMRDRYKLISQDIIKIQKDGLFVSLTKGTPSQVEYEAPNSGEKIILSYNPIKEKMPTVAQQPDNVLTLVKGNGSTTYQYVFDSKYKISSTYEETDDEKGSKLTPGPKEEDINTMHRYRDAIVSASGFYPYERSMFGAYVLFPYNNEEEYQSHKFYKSIEKVNIGGLPFLPSATTLVTKLLDDLIADSPDAAFERTTLPLGIEKKLAKIDWSVRDVLLIGPLHDRNQWDEWKKGNYCHIQESKIAESVFPIHYIAIYQNFDKDPKIQYFGEVTKCIPNQKVPSTSNKKYYRFEVKTWEKLDPVIQVKDSVKTTATKIEYTNKFLLEHCAELSELQLQSEAEYRFYSEIKRVAKNISIHRDPNGIFFQYDNAKINFQDGKISAQLSDASEVSYDVETFLKEPGPTFRRLQKYIAASSTN